MTNFEFEIEEQDADRCFVLVDGKFDVRINRTLAALAVMQPRVSEGKL